MHYKNYWSNIVQLTQENLIMELNYSKSNVS